MTNVMTNNRATDRVPITTDLVIIGAAVICALITWLVGAQLGGVDLVVNTGAGAQPVNGWAVGITAAVAALAGLAALRVLERFTGKALRIWTIVAVAVALLSLFGPLAATTAAATGTLMALHGVVAAVVIVGGMRSRRARVR